MLVDLRQFDPTEVVIGEKLDVLLPQRFGWFSLAAQQLGQLDEQSPVSGRTPNEFESALGMDTLDPSDAYGVGVGSWDSHTVRWLYSQFPPGTDEAARSMGSVIKPCTTSAEAPT